MNSLLFNPLLPRHLPLVGILIAYGASVTGNMIASIALPWFVLELIGDAALTGVVAFVSTILVIIGTLFGGVYIDRLGRRPVSIVADIASAISVAAVPILHGLIGIQFWQLLIVVFLGAFLDAPGMTARDSLLPEVARLARTPLHRLNAMTETIQGLGVLIGPAIAGVLIANLGALTTLWATAGLSLAAALVSLGTLPVRLGQSRLAQPEPYGESLKAGLRFVRRDRLIKALIGLFAALTLIAAPLMSVILPVFVRQQYGSTLHLSLLISAYGIGSVIGFMGYGLGGDRLSPHGLLVVSILAMSAMFAVFAWAPPLSGVLAASAIGGLFSAPFNPIVNTVQQQRTPAELRGRILSTVNGVSSLAAPIGLLISGILLEVFGVQVAIAVIAVCAASIALWVMVSPVFKTLEKP
ncbi:MAG: MFS transporter [Nodosilinea sp.]